MEYGIVNAAWTKQRVTCLCRKHSSSCVTTSGKFIFFSSLYPYIPVPFSPFSTFCQNIRDLGKKLHGDFRYSKLFMFVYYSCVKIIDFVYILSNSWLKSLNGPQYLLAKPVALRYLRWCTCQFVVVVFVTWI